MKTYKHSLLPRTRLWLGALFVLVACGDSTAPKVVVTGGPQLSMEEGQRIVKPVSIDPIGDLNLAGMRFAVDVDAAALVFFAELDVVHRCSPSPLGRTPPDQ